MFTKDGAIDGGNLRCKHAGRNVVIVCGLLWWLFIERIENSCLTENASAHVIICKWEIC